MAYCAWLEERDNHSMWWYGQVFRIAHCIYPYTQEQLDDGEGFGFNAFEVCCYWESIEQEYWNFSLVLPSGDLSEDDVELLFAGCADCVPCVSNGIATLRFTRRALSYEYAVVSAMLDVNSVGFLVKNVVRE